MHPVCFHTCLPFEKKQFTDNQSNPPPAPTKGFRCPAVKSWHYFYDFSGSHQNLVADSVSPNTPCSFCNILLLVSLCGLLIILYYDWWWLISSFLLWENISQWQRWVSSLSSMINTSMVHYSTDLIKQMLWKQSQCCARNKVLTLSQFSLWN